VRKLTPAAIALKAAFKTSLSNFGSLAEAAKLFGRTKGRLSEWSNIDNPLTPIIDICFDIDRVAVRNGGDPAIGRAYMRRLGFDIVPLEIKDKDAEDVAAIAGSIAREAGEVVASSIEAASSGGISPNEARHIHNEVGDLIKRSMDLESAVTPMMVASS
jgi:hypothetical protein